MELTFVQEPIPKISRAGGSGREPVYWENELAELRDVPENVGQSFRVWTYDKRSSAVSRLSSIRERLTKVVPDQNWQMAVRPTPDATVVGEDDKGQKVWSEYGAYIAYLGQYTNDEVAANAKARQERSDKLREARAARTSANGSTEVSDESSAEPTAKERVAAARAAKK